MDWVLLLASTVALLVVVMYGYDSLLRSKVVTMFPLLRVVSGPELVWQFFTGQPGGNAKLGLLESGGGGGMITVEQIMKRGPLKIHSKESVKAASALMKKHRIGSLLIEDGWGEIQGIVTETDIVRKVVALDGKAGETAVEEIMSAPVITVDCKQSLKDADELMDRHGIRHLAVTDGGKIVGVLSVRDLLRPISMDLGSEKD